MIFHPPRNKNDLCETTNDTTDCAKNGFSRPMKDQYEENVNLPQYVSGLYFMLEST